MKLMHYMYIYIYFIVDEVGALYLHKTSPTSKACVCAKFCKLGGICVDTLAAITSPPRTPSWSPPRKENNRGNVIVLVNTDTVF